MLPPTSERLLDPDAVPYFLWDAGMTVGEAHRVIAGTDCDARDEVIVRILREANTRDVWLFLGWDVIDEAWSRIVGRLNQSHPI